MVPDRSRLHPAFILHRRPYSNNSLLLECFTPEQGRFPAIAKGALSGRGATVSLLQPFRPLLIQTTGRGEVKTLTTAEADGRPIVLQGEALYCGFYLNELLMRLLGRFDPHPVLFSRYTIAMERLPDPEGREHTLRRFELALLSELGYGLLLEQEAETGLPIQPDVQYYYVLERGPTRNMIDEALPVSGRSLLVLAGREPQMGPGGWREARELMRHVLARYLGDRPLKSRELFISLQGNRHNE
jgi:DNA repair protein RecO (recombination protein O)